jgi:hypothetical protein
VGFLFSCPNTTFYTPLWVMTLPPPIEYTGLISSMNGYNQIQKSFIKKGE